jgi:hypothetical protein
MTAKVQGVPQYEGVQTTWPQYSVSYFKFHMTNSVKVLYSSYVSFPIGILFVP